MLMLKVVTPVLIVFVSACGAFSKSSDQQSNLNFVPKQEVVCKLSENIEEKPTAEKSVTLDRGAGKIQIPGYRVDISTQGSTIRLFLHKLIDDGKIKGEVFVAGATSGIKTLSKGDHISLIHFDSMVSKTEAKYIEATCEAVYK